MALTTVDQIKVKRQAQNYASNMSGAAKLALKAFFSGLMQDGFVGKLYLHPFCKADFTAEVVASDAAAKVMFVYAKKAATATDAFLKTWDDASGDGTAGDAMACVPFLSASDEAWLWFPQGCAHGTGVVVGCYTALIGSHGSTESGATNSVDGFVILADA